MDVFEKYDYWKTDAFFDDSTRNELKALNLGRDKKEIEDRFYRDLEFGTGGMRGVMGAGTNRMNIYTVGKATKGLGEYILNTYSQDGKNRGVAIGYDTRNNSEKYSRVAAKVLSSMGIRVYLHPFPVPTPQLSYSVRYWGCVAGIVITASHNPKEYNGYKVYDEFGGQLVPKQANEVIQYVNAIQDYKEIDFTGNSNLVRMSDCTDSYVREVRKQARLVDNNAKQSLRIVYTPLHGTGNVPVVQTLLQEGFVNLDVVNAQTIYDGDFPTVKSPNPEDKKALELGIQQAEKQNADIVLGTDPDGDRVGIAVRTNHAYRLMTGNQVGALMMDYLLESTEYSEKSAVVKTVVTSELGADIARSFGLRVFDTLTGFKYIGEKITQFEKAAKNGAADKAFNYFFGYEESYGYLVGTHAHDKDAVVSSLIICEMAAKYKAEGKTLVDKMDEIYNKYGYYKDDLDSFVLRGKDGLVEIQSMMKRLREEGLPIQGVMSIIDYEEDVYSEPFGLLPKSNVLKYILEDGSWVAVRPSGTEPKIKFYYSVKAKTEMDAINILEKYKEAIYTYLQLQ
ncbi:MAG: phospho-sugar mutase [Oscillospiraceae bacterium]|nr:phospho-sugar mutase [Oscillospiraceae bacterium]